MLYNTMMQVVGQNSLLQQSEIDKSRGIIYFQTDEIKISNRSMAPMHIDGEPVQAERRIHAVVEKKCFKLLADKEVV